MLTSSHPQHAEDRTASLATDRRRRRMSGGAVVLLAAALLLAVPATGWAQRVLVIDLVDIKVCETTGCAINSNNTDNYNVNLGTVPTGTVTVTLAVESDHPKPPSVSKELLTFTPDNWSSSQAVTVTGTDDDVDNPGGFRLATIKHTANGGGFSTNKTVHVAVENDDDAAGITLSVSDADADAVTVTEGGLPGPSDTYTVVLDSEPTGTVTVSLKVGGTHPDAATVKPASLTFTPDDWNDAQTVTVTGVPDDTAGARSAEVTYTPIGGSYENVSINPTAVTVNDVGRTEQDAAGVIFDPAPLMIDEGGTGAYTIRLTSSPGTSNAGVTLSIPPDRDVIEKTSLGQGKLIFTAANWNVPQRVEVTVKDDPVSVVRMADITHTFTNYSVPDGTNTLSVTARDTDKKGLSISISSRALTFGENAFRRYSVKLTSKPTAAVTVTISGAKTTVAAVTYKDRMPLTELTFTDANWNETQNVFVRGFDDAVKHPGGRSMTITHTADGGGYSSTDPVPVPVKVKITDVGDDPEITISDFPPERSIPDGDTPRSYMVGLSTSPSTDVTVTLDMESVKGSDGLSTTDCASASKSIPLRFTAASTATTLPEAQTVRICVEDDEDSPGSSRRVTITHTASGGEYSDVPAVIKRLTVTDDEDSKDTITKKLRISKVGGFSVGEANGVKETDTGGIDNEPDVDRYGTPVSYTVKLDSTDDIAVRTVTLSGHSGIIKITTDQAAARSNPDGITSATNLDFTTDNETLTVYVIGVNDNVVGSRSTSIVHTVTTGGDSDSYNPIEVPITVSDHGDAVGLLITKTLTGDELPRPVINEPDGMSTYYVRLRSSPPPGEEVVVHVVSREPSSADVTLPSSKKLTFTPGEGSSWNAVQTVTVTAKGDMVDNPGGGRSVEIIHTPEGPGYGYSQRKDITVTVKDDSDAAEIIVGNPLSAVYEGKKGTFTVALITAPQVGKTVAVRVTSDSSKATVSPSSLTFTHANWKLAQTVTVTGVSGSREGVDTAVTLTPSGGNYGARAKKVEFEVVRSNEPGLRVSPQQLEVSEGGKETYTVELNTDPEQTVTVSISSGSILAVSPKSLTFTGGDDGDWDASQTVTVTGREDTLIGDRSATITHAAANYSSDKAEVRVTVTDNDATVAVSESSVEVAEARGTARYTMKLNGQPTGNVTVTVESSNISAATVSPGSLTFTPSSWNTPKTVTVTGVDDSSPGGNRSATIRHSASGGGYDEADVSSVSVTVTDDDGMTVSPAAVTVAEAGGPAPYTVRLSTQPTGNVTVTVTSGSGAATASPGSLTFTPSNWNTPKTVTVTGVNDDLDNGVSRSATITNEPSGAGYSSSNSLTVAVTVTDDEAAPTLEIRGGEATEGNAGTTRLTFTVTKSGATDQVVTVAYADAGTAGTGTATAGTDYTAVAKGTLTFAPNETSKTVTVMVRGDVVSEPDETIVIALSNPSNATFPGGETTVMDTGTIIDDDASRISIATGAAEPVVEGKPLIFTVSLDPPIDDQQVTVEVDTGGTATAGTDYMGVPETLTFAAGEAAKTITVEVVDDADYELDETVEVELRNPRPSGDVVIEPGEAMAMVTIEDNDAPPALSISGMSVAEGNAGTTSKLTFRVTKSGGTSMAATVAYEDAETGTATSGTDYTAVTAGTLTFAPKETSKTITVVVKGDDESEGNETVVIALSSPSNATIAEGKGAASGTIIDDDTLPRVATDWLARFGRTAAGATLDAIARRMNDGPAAEPSLTVAGHRAAFAPEPVGHGAAATAAPWEEGWTRALTIEDLANGSSFDAGADFVEGLNVWAATSYNQFEMTPQGDYTMDGSLMSAILGVDHQGDTHVVGLALAYHGGGGDFGGIGKTEGSLGTNLYSVHPYVRLTFGEVFHVGGSFGLGTGDLSITDKDGDALVETGVGMPVLAAVDARMELSLAEAWLLALQADGHLVQMVADERLPRFTRVETNTHRLRLGVENSYAFLITDGVSLAPVLETGLRYDGGDAVETGLGFDIGGGLRLDATGAAGLMVDARGHVSLNNWGEGQEQAPALRDWGLGGVIRWRPDFGGHGPEVTLAPSYGAAAGGLNPGAIPSLDAEVGYRLPAFGGVLTPYSSAVFAGSGQRSYRAGAHLEFGHAVEVSAEGTYQQSATGDAEQFLTLRARLRQ